MALFTNAPKVEAAPKGKKKKKDVIQHLIKGLSRFAAIDAAIKSLTALAKVEEETVKAEMVNKFIALGMERNAKPDNFEGLEAKASASCQLKIRSSASPLSDEEAVLLKKAKIPFSKKITQQEAFLINPAYTNNMELLSKVEEALASIALPADFILQQDEISVLTVSAESIDAVFALKDEKKVRALLPLVTTVAVKPKIEGNFWAILDDITEETSGDDSSEEEGA
jgi:hypothetical protein